MLLKDKKTQYKQNNFKKDRDSIKSIKWIMVLQNIITDLKTLNGFNRIDQTEERMSDFKNKLLK